MPIQEENIVFVESQVLDDVPEGGGAATGRVVPDGELNNVFEDISDLDRAYGRFNLRKLFLAIRSLDTSLYGGAKLAVTALPNDPALGYALFTTKDPFDTRSSAANRVAAYLYKGPMWHGALWENHITGMRQIRLIQRVGTAVPVIGKTLCLTQFEGAATEREQYVRVIKVESTIRTFEDDRGEYQRLIVSLDLSDSLRFDFTGHTPNRYDSYNYATGVRARDTTVADATQYFSAHPMVVAAAIGDTQVRAASMFASLVPSAQSETPLAYQRMTPDLVDTLDAGGGHAVEVAQVAHTLARSVTAENRRLNWIETLSPLPKPGTLSVAFMAQGNWYELTEDGGTISGSYPTIGAGSFDAVTGSAAITLGALPDAGSQIVFTWASAVHYQVVTGTYPASYTLRHSLGEAVSPGSLAVTWMSGGVERMAVSDAAGLISGDCSGYISHPTGDIRLDMTRPPDTGTLIGLDYTRHQAVTTAVTGLTAADGMVTIDLDAAIKPGSLTASWRVLQTSTYSDTTYLYETVYTPSSDPESQGTWEQQLVATDSIAGSMTNTRVAHSINDNALGGIGEDGVIDYASGLITLPVFPAVYRPHWVTELSRGVFQSGSGWDTAFTLGGEDDWTFPSGEVIVSYIPASADSEVVSTTIEPPPVRLRLVPRLVNRPIVPGSVRFNFGGIDYQDQGTGRLFSTNNGESPLTDAGQIDYATGWVTLSAPFTPTVDAPTLNVTSCLTRYGNWVGIEANFRTQLAPIKPEALSITVTAEDGEVISAIADADGNFVGDNVRGAVNYEFGTAWLEFGAIGDDPTYTPPEGETPAPPQVWIPRRVDPSTLRYNAVAYSYLPLDADILGIDPVRLPADGRVPVYRKGDIVQIMHTAETAPITPTVNVPFSVGRTRLAWARVIDAEGVTVSGDRYELDRASGQLMFTDLTDVALPITVKHTVGDLRMVTDAQISGWLQLSRALTHDYPADESIIASCLIFGDRRARVSAVFDQASWDNTWQDSVKGSEATATLNTIDFPITVTNEGADTDRWVFRCTNATTHAWELISEKRGLVWSGTYAPYVSGTPNDVRPINPRTRVDLGGGAFSEGTPYMVIPQKANGGGWSTGNVVRINTVGAIADFWIARSIQQSDEPLDPAAPDGCELYALGNIDRP